MNPRTKSKLLYMSSGFQVMGAIVFALCGKLGHAMLAVFFAMVGYYGGQFWENYKDEDNIGE